MESLVCVTCSNRDRDRLGEGPGATAGGSYGPLDHKDKEKSGSVLQLVWRFQRLGGRGRHAAAAGRVVLVRGSAWLGSHCRCLCCCSCRAEPQLLQERRNLHPGQLLRLPALLHREELRVRPARQVRTRPGDQPRVGSSAVSTRRLLLCRSCGLISHGEWVQKGCSYCRCGYGVLHCFANIFHNDCGKRRKHQQRACPTLDAQVSVSSRLLVEPL